MTGPEKFWLVFFLLWLVGGGVLLAFDHYISGGLMLGSFMGLCSWSVIRGAK